jgi:hypothetical protein
MGVLTLQMWFVWHAGRLIRRQQLPVVVGLPKTRNPASAACSLLRSFLFDVSPFDPGVLALSAVAMLLLALAASALPARRASSTDPMMALRGE